MKLQWKKGVMEIILMYYLSYKNYDKNINKNQNIFEKEFIINLMKIIYNC